MNRALTLIAAAGLATVAAAQTGTLFVGQEGGDQPMKRCDLAAFPGVSYTDGDLFDVQGAAATPAGAVYIVNGFFSSDLYMIPPGGSTPVYRTHIGIGIHGLGYVNNKLYGFANYASPMGIYEINPTTGATTLVVSTAAQGYRFFGLDGNPDDGMLYGFTEYGSEGLWQINPDTGAMHKVAATPPGSYGMCRGMAVGNNTAYLVDTNPVDTYFAYNLSQGDNGAYTAFPNPYPGSRNGGGAWIPGGGGGPTTPSVAFDYGRLGNASVSNTLFYPTATIQWMKLTVPYPASDRTGFYIDIDTIGNSLSNDGDTELALYDSTGSLLATRDDSGDGLFTPLTFGDTSPARSTAGTAFEFDGRDGSLPSGEYYLAVGGWESTFGPHFAAASVSDGEGSIPVNVRSNFVSYGTLLVGQEGADQPIKTTDLSGFPSPTYTDDISYDMQAATAIPGGFVYLIRGTFTSDLEILVPGVGSSTISRLSVGIQGLGYTNGKLYGFANFASPMGIYEIDPTTGSCTLAVSTEAQGLRFFALDGDNETGLLYGFSEYGLSGLYSVNPVTGDIHRIAPTPPNSYGMCRGMAVGHHTAYLVDTHPTDSFYAYDLTQGDNGTYEPFTNPYPNSRNGGGAWLGESGPVSPPAVAADFGTLASGEVTQTAACQTGQVRWFKFSTPAEASDATGFYVDMNTSGTTLDNGGDTEIGLYTSTGTRLANRDDVPGDLYSALSFGLSNFVRPWGASFFEYIGQDGILPAGDYYVAVSGWETLFGDSGFGVLCVSGGNGDIPLTIRSNFNAPCPADFNNDGGVDGSDVEAFFLAWESGSTPADVNQDGGVDGGDVESFFLSWEAGGC